MTDLEIGKFVPLVPDVVVENLRSGGARLRTDGGL
jgi:hypothetical protein